MFQNAFRVHTLEEQLRDVEIKAQAKMHEEEKKNREFMVCCSQMKIRQHLQCDAGLIKVFPL